MIENAVYYAHPPDVTRGPINVRPPLHEYLRTILYKDLNKLNTEKVPLLPSSTYLLPITFLLP